MRRVWFALIVTFSLFLAGVASGPFGAGATGGPHVVTDRMAGRDRMTPHGTEQGDTTVEPSIAVNPTDPANAVTVYQMGRIDAAGDEANGYATTSDGGATWTFGHLPRLTRAVGGPWDRASDPVVAFGPDGTVYANSLVFDEGDETAPSGVAVNVSTDGGKTWSRPTYPDNQQTDNDDDKNWLTVDQSDASGHHRGRVYVVWDRFGASTGIFLSYSDDRGQTWSPASIVYAGGGVGAIPLVMPNGDLAVVFETFSAPSMEAPGAAHAQTPREREAARQVGGASMVIAVASGAGNVVSPAPIPFAAPTTIGTYRGYPIRQQRAGGLPAAAVDTSGGPHDGRIYVGWEDGRFRKDRANDAVVTWSDTEGSTWHRLKPVDPGPRGNWVDHYNTTLAVGDDGSLRVAYLFRQEAPSVRDFSRYVHVFYEQSLDGGRTFSPPLRIDTRRRSNVRFAAFSRGGAFFGDYDQLAVAGSRTYVATCRAYRVRRREPETFPPTVHHQRTWVTVVGGG